GCIAYELFTGRRPFDASTIYTIVYKHMNEQPTPPRQLNPQLPIPIEQAILKAMAKDRAARYADVAMFVAAIGGSASDPNTGQKTKEQWLNEGSTYYAA